MTVTFSKPVLGSGTVANYRLQSAGADGLLGTADDTAIALASVTAGNPATLNFAGLAAGIYRLTVFDTITDTLGNGAWKATVCRRATSPAISWCA